MVLCALGKLQYIDRAAGYDMLLVEEVEAVQKKKGMHGPQAKASLTNATPPNDLTGDPKRAKAFFGTLSKDKTHKAIIEHIFTGSRFKVTIPSENVTLQLALSQVRTPMVSKSNTPVASHDGKENLEEGEVKEDPLAKWVEAGKRYSRYNLLQRKVDVEISDIDRNGIMLGKVFTYGENNRTTPFASSLVEKGLASVDKYSQRKGGQEIMTLLEIQSDAQSEKRGMWVEPEANPSPQKDSEEESENVTAADVEDADDNMFRVSLTEIYDGANFAVNFVEQPNESDNALLRGQMKLAEVEEMMASFAKNVSDDGSIKPTKGMLLAVHDEDPSSGGEKNSERVWLRGCVEEKLDSDRVVVLFVDYGHRGTVSLKDIRELPLPLQHYAPQAIPCTLSFLRAPGVRTESGVGAARALNSLAWGKACLIKVHGRVKSGISTGGKSGGENKTSYTPPAKLEVSLYAVDSYSEEDLAHATNVGVKLVRHGFLRISATLARKERGLSRPRRRGGNKTLPHVETTNETLHELEVAQDLAHREHLRMWAYGHPGDSDDEEEVRKDEKTDDKKK